MSTGTVDIHNNELGRSLLAWANERFPLENGVVVLLVTALGVLFGRALAHPGAVHLKLSDLGAFVAVWCYFLLLRIFDEHKDYELDLHNHPDRVLQSGRITLAHLKVLGAVAVVVQLGVSLAIDRGVGAVTGLWALLMAWTLLMLREFFIEWPSRWFVLYAFMHMLSMPLAFLWLAEIGAKAGLPPPVRWLVVLGGLIAASMEVARKFRAPADERDTIDTYTRALGIRRASVTLVALLVSAAATSAGLLSAAADVAAAVYAVGLPVSVAPGLAGVARYVRDPTAANAELVEKLAGLTVLLLLVLLLASLLIARGVG